MKINTYFCMISLFATAQSYSVQKKSMNRRDLLGGVAAAATTWAFQQPSANAVDLDFSLPTYDTKMSGFGEGKEAILNQSTENLEKTRQLEASKKAAEALRDKRLKDQEMRKLQYEADKQKALEKKARDAERLKNIWG